MCDSKKMSQLVWNGHARICGGKSGLGRQPGWILWRQHFFVCKPAYFENSVFDIGNCDLKLWPVEAPCWTPERGLSDAPHIPSRFWSFLQFPVPFWWNLQARISLLPGNFVILGFSPESGKKKNWHGVNYCWECWGTVYKCDLVWPKSEENQHNDDSASQSSSNGMLGCWSHDQLPKVAKKKKSCSSEL